MHLKLMAARAATVVALSCASISITSLAVYADANPNNHGHHYGQLKHQHPPAPAPQPPPAPAPITKPPAVVPIVSHPDGPIVQATPTPVSSGPKLPLPDLGGNHTQKQTVAALPPVRDPNLWIVEALLPALLIVWLMLAASRALKNPASDGKAPAA